MNHDRVGRAASARQGGRRRAIRAHGQPEQTQAWQTAGGAGFGRTRVFQGAAREGPQPPADLTPAHAEALQQPRTACSAQYRHRHTKAQALATELINDWEAIFRVLQRPTPPLINNSAERRARRSQGFDPAHILRRCQSL